MSGKNILTWCLVASLIVQPLILVATQESEGDQMLVIKAEPVSTQELREEWSSYKFTYVIMWAVIYSIVFLK